MDRMLPRNRRIDAERQIESEWCCCWLDSTRGTDKRRGRIEELKSICCCYILSIKVGEQADRRSIIGFFFSLSLRLSTYMCRWLSSFESHSVLFLSFLSRLILLFSMSTENTQLNISHEDLFLRSIRPRWSFFSTSDEKCRTAATSNNSRAVSRERETEKRTNITDLTSLEAKKRQVSVKVKQIFFAAQRKGGGREREEQKRKYYIASCM